jgi:hypothetical protein
MSKVCSKCKIQKSIDEFRLRKDTKDGHRSYCKTCQDKKNKDYLSTLEGCITQLLGHAKSKAEDRKKKNRNDNSGEFTLVRDDILDLWNNQNGLCYYSNLPITFKDAWKISLERLNQSFGYTKETSVLICTEFNVASQWTQDKIIEMLMILDEDIQSNYINFDLKRNIKIQEFAQKSILNDVIHS